MPKPQAKLSTGASQARIMFLSLPIFFVVCALIAYGLRLQFGFAQPMSVYVAALPALVIGIALAALIVRFQARRRAAKAAKR